MLQKQKILVTGANGQLGRSFRDIASRFPQFEFIFVSKEDLPVHHFEVMRSYFKVYQPQWLINCAAYTAVDRAEAEKDLAMQVNAESVGVMAAITAQHNCGFIHISTDYVFDGLSSHPYKEDHPTAPQNSYGRSKLEGEIQAFQLNPKSLVIRSSWIYSEHGNNFVKTMLRLMKEKPSINVVNDQFGCPTYARDLAGTIMIIIMKDHREGGIFHFCNKGIISWYDFAVAIKELTGSSCSVNPIPTNQYPTPSKRPAYSALDTQKLEEKFEIEIRDWKTSLIDCLGRMS